MRKRISCKVISSNTPETGGKVSFYSNTWNSTNNSSQIQVVTYTNRLDIVEIPIDDTCTTHKLDLYI